MVPPTAAVAHGRDLPRISSGRRPAALRGAGRRYRGQGRCRRTGAPGHRRTDGLGREGQERCARPRRFSASADRDDGVQDGIDHGGRDVQLIPACFPLRVISSCASFSPSPTSVETCVQAARSIDKGQHYSFPHARCICNIICIESTKTADARSFAPCIRKMRALLGHHVARAFRSRETCSSDSMCYTLS